MKTTSYRVVNAIFEHEQEERKLLLLMCKNAAMASVGNNENPISVNLSHVEKDVENALIARVSGSGGGQRVFRGFRLVMGCTEGGQDKYGVQKDSMC